MRAYLRCFFVLITENNQQFLLLKTVAEERINEASKSTLSLRHDNQHSLRKI